jgi:hypothetical protein
MSEISKDLERAKEGAKKTASDVFRWLDDKYLEVKTEITKPKIEVSSSVRQKNVSSAEAAEGVILLFGLLAFAVGWFWWKGLKNKLPPGAR